MIDPLSKTLARQILHYTKCLLKSNKIVWLVFLDKANSKSIFQLNTAAEVLLHDMADKNYGGQLD
jgi:hypothetical protein